jgi:hypothetical protein
MVAVSGFRFQENVAAGFSLRFLPSAIQAALGFSLPFFTHRSLRSDPPFFPCAMIEWSHGKIE